MQRISIESLFIQESFFAWGDAARRFEDAEIINNNIVWAIWAPIIIGLTGMILLKPSKINEYFDNINNDNNAP